MNPPGSDPDEPTRRAHRPGVGRRRAVDARAAREERLAERARVTDPAVVLAAGARLLEARARSATDTRSRLLRSGYPPALVEAAIMRLTELGFLDDEAFARNWVESRDRARPRGERALRHELRARGVEHDLVERTLGERAASMDGEPGEPEAPSADEAAALRLLERRRRAFDRIEGGRARRQWAYGLLARNGFDPDVAGRVSARFSGSESTEAE